MQNATNWERASIDALDANNRMQFGELEVAGAFGWARARTDDLREDCARADHRRRHLARDDGRARAVAL
ncbi:MAG: hypothetical protein IPK60_20875 [Sandaracinaceae bacterium]|nr:hypothetical protein [Sandaracinaceae bacterium]